MWLKSRTTELGVDKQQRAFTLKTIRRIPLMESRWLVTRYCRGCCEKTIVGTA
jgi:hypothetical protein